MNSIEVNVWEKVWIHFNQGISITGTPVEFNWLIFLIFLFGYNPINMSKMKSKHNNNKKLKKLKWLGPGSLHGVDSSKRKPT